MNGLALFVKLLMALHRQSGKAFTPLRISWKWCGARIAKTMTDVKWKIYW